ncbi:hypothetical protein AVEN_79056-1 [Araneus ventricosus]|uniref:Uncharacterized protein n=1 Tax=Araneus ventricosus TaxID=182803 RepID=A0A4Y2T8V5_ARAVE|nr:hypothetical protein AVEN_79056-1 [Araneus ventricosus]
MFSAHLQNSILRSGSSSVSYCNICSLHGCHLLSGETRMPLPLLIPICAERRRFPFVGLLSIAASTCVDIPSSVFVFGILGLVASATEPALPLCHGLFAFYALH